MILSDCPNNLLVPIYTPGYLEEILLVNTLFLQQNIMPLDQDSAQVFNFRPIVWEFNKNPLPGKYGLTILSISDKLYMYLLNTL